MKVAIIGTGYVGLTTGVCLSFLGHEVTCLDTDAGKVERLRAGHAPIFEPHLEDLMADEGVRHRLRFTTSYAEAIPTAEVVFIAVGTPSLPNGSPDLQYLNAAAGELGRFLGSHFTVIVNKSTVPIGSGNWVEALVRDTYVERNGREAGTPFSVASNPEFLREGSALEDSLYPDRVVIGADNPRALEVLYSLYRPLLDQNFVPPPYLPRPEAMNAVPLVSTDLASAELIKYAANAFLSLKISYINEIGRLSRKVGANIRHVARGIGLDDRIGPRFLNAGIGWGGSCFAKDTAALVSTAKDYSLTMPIVQAAREVNLRQRELVVDVVQSTLKILKGKTVGILGLAFKPNTDDLRDAPALDIAKRLIERGARVRATDPIAMEGAKRLIGETVALLESPVEVARDADAVVLVTEWHHYQEMDWAALRDVMRTPHLIDGRHFLDPERMTALGFQYQTIG